MKKRKMSVTVCALMHVDACWLTALWGLCAFVLWLHRPRWMLDPLSEVLHLASLLLSLGSTNSPLCMGGRKEGMVQISERRRQMGDQQKERGEEIKEWRRQQDHMWCEHAHQCCQRLSVQIKTSRGTRNNKNSCLPRGRCVPLDINRQHF